MAKRPQTTTAERRRWVLVGAAIGWILIVVVGAGEASQDSLLGVDNIEIVWVIFLSVLALMGLVLLLVLNPFASEWKAPEKQRRGVGVWFLVAVVAVLWVWRPNFFLDATDEDSVEVLSEALDLELDTTPEESVETVAQATDLLLIALVVAALGGVWYYLGWRARQGVEEPVPSNLTLEADLAQALEEASRELAITGDPRTAVLRSYAVLETVLATHGSARDQAETPTEHMRRSLQNLRVESEPLVELGALYELARFSEHPITAAQRDEAAQALARARTSLAGQS